MLQSYPPQFQLFMYRCRGKIFDLRLDKFIKKPNNRNLLGRRTAIEGGRRRGVRVGRKEGGSEREKGREVGGREGEKGEDNPLSTPHCYLTLTQVAMVTIRTVT